MKKILVSALAIAMLLALLPATALAATYDAGDASGLATAISSAANGDTINLTADITGIEEMTIDKAITIDMNGHNISGSPSSTIAFRVVGGDLTLDNTSATQSKLLVGTGETDEYSYEGIRIAGSGNVTVNANISIEAGCPVVIYGDGTEGSAQLDVYGSLTVSACLPSGDAYSAIQGRGNTGMGGTIINIYDGAEVLNAYTMGMYIPQAGVVNVYGGTITGVEAAIGIKSGTLNISGGTLSATGEANIPTEGWSNGINGSGCAIQIESNDGYSGDIVVNITGGTIFSANGYPVYEYLESETTDTEVDSIDISGGTFQTGAAVDTLILTSEELDTSDVIEITGGIFLQSASEVTATADVTYMVVIPTSVDFGTINKGMDAQSKDFAVAVEDALIEDGSSITVENTTSDMTMKDKDGTGVETLAFTLAQDAAPDNGIFTFAQADLTDGAEGIISSVGCVPADLTAAGSYKGYMTFEVSYITAP